MNEVDFTAINKEDALDILDRTIGFVNNCDNKASVVLGVFGVLLTILFSNEGVTELKNIIKTAINSGTYYGVIYCVFLSCTAIGLAFGIITLFRVLFPKTNCDDLKQEDLELNSKIFFSGISKNSYRQYKEKITNCSEAEYLNDIISQIYINSIICNLKFERYTMGVVASLIGFISFMAIWGFGIIAY